MGRWADGWATVDSKANDSKADGLSMADGSATVDLRTDGLSVDCLSLTVSENEDEQWSCWVRVPPLAPGR